MSKKIYIFLVIFLAAWGVDAQVEQKDLIGKWKLVSSEDEEAAIDAVRGTFVIKEDRKKTLSAEELKEVELDYTILARQYKNVVLTIGQTDITQAIGEELYKGTYSLYQTDGITEITITEDGIDMVAEISLKKGLLVLEVYEDGIVYTYRKL